MKYRICVLFVILSIIFGNKAFSQDITFSKENFAFGGIALPYRKADIPGSGDRASLVVYLHGGSSKGDDNETQMQEPGIQSICTWLCKNKRKSIMLVPQCPTNMSWLGTMQDVIVRLLQTYIDRGIVNANQVYIFGGSMGGTGTWNMLSVHPELFAAAMPVAGNPTGLNAEVVAKVPLFTVMGTADEIMNISNVEAFLPIMDEYSAEYKFDIEDGWTHEDVCTKSYTDERLEWVFKHTKDNSAGITHTTSERVSKVVWYDINGMKLSNPPKQKGVYIKKSIYDDGGLSSEKCFVNW